MSAQCTCSTEHSRSRQFGSKIIIFTKAAFKLQAHSHDKLVFLNLLSVWVDVYFFYITYRIILSTISFVPHLILGVIHFSADTVCSFLGFRQNFKIYYLVHAATRNSSLNSRKRTELSREGECLMLRHFSSAALGIPGKGCLVGV